MNKKIIILITNFILCTILFILDILFLVQFNVSRGINKKEITKLIDNINVRNQLYQLEIYKKLDNSEKQLVEEIFNSKETEEYIKENIKSICFNILYNENIIYMENNKFSDYVNNYINKKIEEYGISEESLEKITNVTNEIIDNIEIGINKVTNSKEEIKIITNILSKKTSNYLLVGIILVSTLLIIINKSYRCLIWIGLPTFISGGIFLLLTLSLNRTINMITIDNNIYEIINQYFMTLLNALKKSSIIFVIIGTISCTLYAIFKYQNIGENNGKI